MWDNVVNFIKLIEPLIVVIIPLCFGIYLKIKLKCIEKKQEVLKKVNSKKKQELLDWRHKESINVINKLKEVCNYHCDIGHVHTSYIQLENGTIATSKLCNMFFSCVAEDNRYSDLRKMIDSIQRIPYTRMSNWFNKIYNSEYQVVYLIDKRDIDDIFTENIGIRCMISSLVKDSKGLVIGVCNFVYSDEQDIEDLNESNAQMLKFVSSVETIFLDFNLELETKKKELHLEDIED